MHQKKRKGECEETDQPQNANIIAVSGPTCLQTHTAVLPGDRQSGHRQSEARVLDTALMLAVLVRRPVLLISIIH